MLRLGPIVQFLGEQGGTWGVSVLMDTDAASVELADQAVAAGVDQRDLDGSALLRQPNSEIHDHALQTADVQTLRDQQNARATIGVAKGRLASSAPACLATHGHLPRTLETRYRI